MGEECMKRKMKRPLALLLTMMMLLSVGVQVLAETPKTGDAGQGVPATEISAQTVQTDESEDRQEAEPEEQESVPGEEIRQNAEKDTTENQDGKNASESDADNHEKDDSEIRADGAEGSGDTGKNQNGKATSDAKSESDSEKRTETGSGSETESAAEDSKTKSETGNSGKDADSESDIDSEIRTQASGATVRLTDSIKTDGCLHAEVTGLTDGTTVQVKWWKSSDGSDGSWTEVTRRKITEDRYNISEDTLSLNAALDGGARSFYKVQLLAESGQVLAETTGYQVPYYNELRNGDFESPVIGDGETYQPFFDSGADGVIWKTTAKSGKIEFVSADPTKLDGNSGQTYQYLSKYWHKVEAAADASRGGTQFAELNANESGALYQDVLTTPGATLYWQLSHRARGADSDEYQSGAKDTMYVLIMSTELAEKYNVTTQNKVNQVLADIRRGGTTYPGARVETITSDNISWHQYSGTYQVQEGQYLTRFFFVSGKTASKDSSIGNHLDAVWFSETLPPPNPEAGHLKIQKTVTGLTEEEAANYTLPLTITRTDAGNGSTGDPIQIELTDFQKDSNGNYQATYTQANLAVGTYKVSENVPTVDGYTVNSLCQGNAGTETQIAVSEGQTSNVSFLNEYTPDLVKLTVTKKVTGNMRDPSQKFSFTLEVNGETQNFTLKHGEKAEFEVPRGTICKITETKASGYTTTINGQSSDDRSITQTLQGDTTVEYVNRKEASMPTGVSDTTKPIGMWILLGVVGAAILLPGRSFWRILGKRIRRR